MEICKICLNPISNPDAQKFNGYHNRCTTRLFGSLRVAPTLNVTTPEFYEAARCKKGLSISGAQAKFGVAVMDGKLVIPPDGVLSTHIVKPCPPEYQELPANEHLSMRIAEIAGIETAVCGLIRFADGTLAYIVKRYDRGDKGERIHQEDMMQAMGLPNTEDISKYKGSYEAIARALSGIPGAGLLESAEFIKRSLLMYFLGNGDFHLKNTSIIYTDSSVPKLSPAYDVVNTALYNDHQFLCLDFFEGDDDPTSFLSLGYPTLADFKELAEKVGVGVKSISKYAEFIVRKIPEITTLIENSMLSESRKKAYLNLINERIKTLG